MPQKHNGWNDDEICDFLGLPTPTELLRRARLRYLGILIHCGAHAEWGLLSQDQQWINLVQDDLDVEATLQIVRTQGPYCPLWAMALFDAPPP